MVENIDPQKLKVQDKIKFDRKAKEIEIVC